MKTEQEEVVFCVSGVEVSEGGPSISHKIRADGDQHVECQPQGTKPEGMVDSVSSNRNETS